MQRIYACPLSPEEYNQTDGYRQVTPESVCPRCRRSVALHRHGRYQRWVVTLLAQWLYLWIARFRCPQCRHTISYLPDFAFTYHAVQPDTFAAFLDGEQVRRDVCTLWDRLHGYQRRFEAFGAELIRTVGAGLGLPPPSPRSPEGLWPWLKKAGEGLRPLTRRLVTDFKIGLFKRYHCHQPAGP
jgi:hypothetical protein